MKPTRLFTEDGSFVGLVDNNTLKTGGNFASLGGGRHTLYNDLHQPVGYLLEDKFIPLQSPFAPLGGGLVFLIFGACIILLSAAILVLTVPLAPILGPILILASIVLGWNRRYSLTKTCLILVMVLIYIVAGIAVDGLLLIHVLNASVDIEPVCDSVSVSVDSSSVTVENNSDFTLLTVRMFQDTLLVVVASHLSPGEKYIYEYRGSRIYGVPLILAQSGDGERVEGPCF